ncbi:phage tail assembly chaperone [Lacrimispora sp.]|uniref:phage tail assembly chaperone n=1 Tax=Lacrimispora sp. TaxID=2719234 RepID=UPI0028AEE9B3|nr:hypothetical protein [Lacrimispora sp.]
MAHLRQTEPKQVTVGGYDFYIRPFPAFKAANLSGELASLLVPLLASLAPLVQGEGEDDGSDIDLLDIDITEAAPGIVKAFEGISGDKIEKLLRKLLISNGHIAVLLSNEDGGTEAEVLKEDLVNELFCGEMQDMFLLAFEVIRLNFNGFFKKAGNLFGKVAGAGSKMRKIL